MVIGVEGNVHTGKSTFINKKYLQSDFDIIREISFVPELNSYDRELYYIESEIKRKIDNNNENVILDRTIISTYLFINNSNIFNDNEKKALNKKIKDSIKKKKVFIPDTIQLMIYPYELILKNHELLRQEKGTQNLLTEYKYYLNYNLFYISRMKLIKKYQKVDNFRQIIDFDGLSLFDSLDKPTVISSKVLLDGAPSIGKTTIGSFQKKYDYIPEYEYESYTLENYDNQLNSIIERIKLLQNDNIIADTSFLMGITHLFYNEETTQKFKLEVIDKIMDKIPLYLYTTKIIYLTLDKSELRERKENDKNKNRSHFEDNIQYLSKEINFYNLLDSELKEKSNIYIINANKSKNELINEIGRLEEKPLLINDLFYCITELIKRGEL